MSLTQSLNTRSIANAQMAQQQLGPGFQYGSRFDDGKLATLHGPGGQMTLQEHQTQLGTNVSQNDTLSTMASIQSQFAAQSSLNQSRQAGLQIQEGLGHLYSFVKSFSDQEGYTQGVGSSDAYHAQQSLKNVFERSNAFADEHGLDRQKTFNAMVEAGLKIDKGSFGKGLLGGLAHSLSGGLSGKQSISASDRETLSAVERSGLAKTFSDDLSHGLQYVHDNKSQFSQNKQLQNLEQAQRNFSQAQSYTEQSTASRNESLAWQQQAIDQQQRSISSGSNINDQVLSYVADKNFGGDHTAAAQWQTQNPIGYQQEAGNFLEHRSRSLKANPSPTRQSVEDHYQHAQSSIQTIPVRTEDINQKLQDDHLKTQEQSMRNKMAETGNAFAKTAHEHDKALKDHGLDKEISEKKSNFSNEEDRFLISRAFTGIKRK